jgi:hypothetical protein
MKIRNSVFAVSALAAACLMTWVLPAAAEPEGTKPFSLRFYGGYNHMAAADINKGCGGYIELLELYEDIGGGLIVVEGGYKPVHAGGDFGADVVFQLSPVIGIGVGLGYMRSSRDSRVTC